MFPTFLQYHFDINVTAPSHFNTLCEVELLHPLSSLLQREVTAQIRRCGSRPKLVVYG